MSKLRLLHLSSYFSHSLYSTAVSANGEVFLRSRPMRSLDLPAAGCQSSQLGFSARCKSCRQQTMNPGQGREPTKPPKVIKLFVRTCNVISTFVHCRSAEGRCLLTTSRRPIGQQKAAASVKPNQAGEIFRQRQTDRQTRGFKTRDVDNSLPQLAVHRQ